MFLATMRFDSYSFDSWFERSHLSLFINEKFASRLRSIQLPSKDFCKKALTDFWFLMAIENNNADKWFQLLKIWYKESDKQYFVSKLCNCLAITEKIKMEKYQKLKKKNVAKRI